MWRMVDFDGDGNQDLIVGVGDWTEYGWDNAYNENGRWMNGPLRGYVYVLRNTGTNDKPAYDKPKKIMATDRPVETFGWPSPNFADFDGEGAAVPHVHATQPFVQKDQGATVARHLHMPDLKCCRRNHHRLYKNVRTAGKSRQMITKVAKNTRKSA